MDWRWTSCGRGGSCRNIAWEEGPRRGKPLKSRVANFSEKKRDSTFEVFRLWEWDVVAGVLLYRG